MNLEGKTEIEFLNETDMVLLGGIHLLKLYAEHSEIEKLFNQAKKLINDYEKLRNSLKGINSPVVTIIKHHLGNVFTPLSLSKVYGCEEADDEVINLIKKQALYIFKVYRTVTEDLYSQIKKNDQLKLDENITALTVHAQSGLNKLKEKYRENGNNL